MALRTGYRNEFTHSRLRYNNDDGDENAYQDSAKNLRGLNTLAFLDDSIQTTAFLGYTGYGFTGPIGPIGPTGSIGPRGYQGPQGLTGPQGIQGLIGETGIQGIQGIQGLTGPQGIQGIIGNTGPAGPIVDLQSIVNIGSSITDQNGNAGTLIINQSTGNRFVNQLTGQQMLLNDNQNGTQAYYRAELLSVNDNPNNTASNLYSGTLQLRDNGYVNTAHGNDILISKSNTIEQSLLNTTSLTLTDLSGNIARLSTTNLTFNGVPYNGETGPTGPTGAKGDSFNIGVGITGQVIESIGGTAYQWSNQLITNTNSINKLQYASPLKVANSLAVYGQLPSSPPMIPTTNSLNTGYEGWYYKNYSSIYNNISWGLSFQPSNYIVSNLKGFYFTFVSLTTTSKPFISVYTLPATPPNYYLSRRSYVPASAPATISAGIPYIYYYMFDSSYQTPFKYLHTPVALTVSPVNPVGPFNSNELLYYFSINTNSISALNTEELIIGEAGCIIDDGSGCLVQPFSFISGDVYSPNSYQVVQQGIGTITPTISDMGKTYIALGNFTVSTASLTNVPAGFYFKVQGSNADRTITYPGGVSTVHAGTGSINAGIVTFYWGGSQLSAYY